jgi:hypothetical protein
MGQCIEERILIFRPETIHNSIAVPRVKEISRVCGLEFLKSEVKMPSTEARGN